MQETDRIDEAFNREPSIPSSSPPIASSLSDCPDKNWRFEQLRLLAPIIEHLLPEFLCELEMLENPPGQNSTNFFWSLIQESQKKRRDSSPASETACRALEIIRQRVSQQFLIADLATELGVHRSQLSRWFKASYGVTLSNFARICRIERSIELLNQNEMAISDIALECGFNDQSHFTRQFRETMNTTPAKWRDGDLDNRTS